jgi:hypothetical protein
LSKATSAHRCIDDFKVPSAASIQAKAISQCTRSAMIPEVGTQKRRGTMGKSF